MTRTQEDRDRVIRLNMVERGFRFENDLPIFAPEPNSSANLFGKVFEYDGDGWLWMMRDEFPPDSRLPSGPLYGVLSLKGYPKLDRIGWFSDETSEYWCQNTNRGTRRATMGLATRGERDLLVTWYKRKRSGVTEFFSYGVGQIIDYLLDPRREVERIKRRLDGEPRRLAMLKRNAEAMLDRLTIITTGYNNRLAELLGYNSHPSLEILVLRALKKVGGRPISIDNPLMYTLDENGERVKPVPFKLQGLWSGDLAKVVKHLQRNKPVSKTIPKLQVSWNKKKGARFRQGTIISGSYHKLRRGGGKTALVALAPHRKVRVFGRDMAGEQIDINGLVLTLEKQGGRGFFFEQVSQADYDAIQE